MCKTSFKFNGSQYIVIDGILYERDRGCLVEAISVPGKLARQAAKRGYRGRISDLVDQFHTHAHQVSRQSVTNY